MTEQEWLACTDAKPMLKFLQGQVRDRKYLLFACACGRRVWHLLTDHRSRHAVEVVETYLHSRIPPREVKEALMEAEAACEQFVGADDLDPSLVAATVAQDIAWAAVQGDVQADFIAGLADATAKALATAATDANPDATQQMWETARSQEAGAQAAVLRDVLGPAPFRLAAIHLAWLTPQVRSLAQALQDTGDFHDLPRLAEALAEAGCQQAGLLGHCRQPGPHVRGCWVLDLIVEVGRSND
jgi:hypothetical protein